MAASGGPKLPKGKIAGVQTRYVIVAVMGVVAFLVYRHFKGQQSTSAGSTSVPQPANAGLPAPQDSTGGGASGMGGGDPLANLADTLAAQTNALYSIGATLQGQQPATNTTNNYYPSVAPGPPESSSGANTSIPASASTPTTPPTSHPPTVTQYLSETSSTLDNIPWNTTPTQPLIGGTLTLPQFATGGGGHLTNPVPPTPNYGGTVPLTPQQIRDRNRRQQQ